MNISMLSYEDTVDIIKWCLDETEGTMPLRDDTLELYPELKDNSDVKKAIKEHYDIFYKENNHLVDDYNELWNKYDNQLREVFERIFNIKLYKEINAYIGLLPVCPRDIEHTSFMFIPASDSFFIETSFHEICHFYFFEVVKKLIPDWSYEKFDKPNILWYLSEIMVDPILNSKEVQNIYSHEFRAYDIFYETSIDNKSIIDTFREIYKSHSIEDTILIGLKFLEDNQEEFLNQVN